MLPSGTVTFLFTDIEGSTKMWQDYPAAMPAALARHHAILHEAIKAQLAMAKGRNHTVVYVPTGNVGVPLVSQVPGAVR